MLKLLTPCFLILALAGCKTPPPSSGSLLSSDRSREISDSLDQKGEYVGKMEREASNLKSEIE
ncbi:hypothetical protein [Lacipirellula parvula]|uniref:Uncharacterized protein n=1 Tax=Lacipirellula parvula TaxID=2650471 RepID=A0A5K7XME6_9BACT|nr:hypothetical protein [Lacipirellula parvula]BBO35763.1 hypothetical protein PLANPX_5375 [Lacipirellula parvula]